MDVRVGPWRRLSAEELMRLNCGVREDSWESLGLQGYLYFLKWWKRRINYSQPFFLKRTSHTPPHPTLESMTQRTMVQNLKFSKHWHRLKDLRERENWTLRICPAIVQTINEKDTLLCLQQSLLNRGCQTCDFFFTLLIFPLYKKLYRSYSINKRKFSKTSRDIAANNAIKTLIPRLLMSEFSVSEKRKKWKHCDLNFLDKHKTQFKDLLNIFGKIHFTLIVTHTKLILSRNVTFFCCQLFCLQSCITSIWDAIRSTPGASPPHLGGRPRRDK